MTETQFDAILAIVNTLIAMSQLRRRNYHMAFFGACCATLMLLVAYQIL